MSKYKIIYNKKACIGAGDCERLSKLWKVKSDGRAELLGSKIENGVYELIIDDKDFELEEKVVKSCPVNAIKIIKL